MSRRDIDSKRKRLVRQLVSTLLKAFVSVGLVYSLLRRLGVEDLLGRLKAANPKWIAAALVVFIISNVLGAYQWHVLLRSQKTDISFARSLMLYHIGLFFNNFLLSNIGGDAVRIYDIKKHSGRGTVAVSTVLFDRIIGFTAMAGIAMIAAVVKVKVLTRAELMAIGAVLFLWMCVLAGLFSRRFALWLQIRLHHRLPKKLGTKLAEIYRGIHQLRYEPSAAYKLVLIAPAVQVLRILTHYFAALSVGSEIGVAVFMIFIPLVAFLASLPISFGGVGVREQSAAVLFSQIGSTAPQTVAFEFLAYLVGIFASLPGGLVFALRKTKQN